MMRKRGREQRDPARPRTRAAPCGRSFPARFWSTLSGGAGDAPTAKTKERGERLDPDTQDPAQPGGPSAAASGRLPSSRRRVQKCPFHVGALHVRAGSPQYKNARFSQATCTPPPERTRKSRCSLFPSRRGAIFPVSRLFQLWNSLATGGSTKMYASPNPCTPQRHHGGCRAIAFELFEPDRSPKYHRQPKNSTARPLESWHVAVFAPEIARERNRKRLI